MSGSALDEVSDVLFTEDEVMEYVNPMKEELQAKVDKRKNESGGEAVASIVEEVDGDTVVINGVTYKKV